MTRRRSPSLAATASAALLLLAAAPALAGDPADIDNAIIRPVTIDSTRKATVLEKLASAQDQRIFDIPILSYEQGTWSPLCVTPCHVRVDLNAVYRVGPQNGVTTSRPFTLPPEVAALHVNAGSNSMRLWANGLLVGGSAAVVSGLSTVFATNDATTQHVGFAVGGAGLLGVVVGIPLLIFSATHLRFD
ncbi:MAG TPA: hypothetical protein VGI39_44050 [Polyangiaceae bacterium]